MTPPLSPETLAQHQALIASAGLADFSGRAEIELTGRDRASFLHNFCTADIKRLTPGQGSEAFFCNLQGKILDHGYIVCRESSLVIDTPAAHAEALVKHLDRYLIREDVQFHDRSADVGKLLLSGAASGELVKSLTGAEPPEARCAVADVRLAGVAVSLRRIEFTGPNCLIVVCSAGDVGQVRDALDVIERQGHEIAIRPLKIGAA